MNKEIRAHILQLLEGYPERERKIALLRYELEHAGQISKNEMIETMALGHSDGNGHSDGRISDKTLYIALNYQIKSDKLNGEVKETIVTQLVDLEQTQSRLKYYVSLLEKRQAEVLRLGYFDGLPWEDVAPKVSVALRTVRKIKDRAIDELAAMYAFTKELE